MQHPKTIEHMCLVRTIGAQPVVLAWVGQQDE